MTKPVRDLMAALEDSLAAPRLKLTVAERRKALHRDKQSDLEAELAWQIACDPDIPLPVREFRFCPTRRWRADFAWPEHRLLVEVEGAVWSAGRHVRGHGFTKDAEKANTAQLLWYRVLRFTGPQVTDGTALAAIKEALRCG